MEGAEALQKRGNVHFAEGRFREALQDYAAALAASEGKGQDTERAAALRANRALCCLRLGTPELALAEAERCRELRPDWPKAHFRVAAALEAAGRLGEARLAACEARRLAPADREVGKLLAALRARLFPGPAEGVGVALDALEDFAAAPEATLAAAQQLHDLVMAADDDGPSRLVRVRAFVEGSGGQTLFRRQNAMGTHWREECKNGTMSLLSKVASAAPQLEEELVRLSKEAEAREFGCTPGESTCTKQVAGKAGDSALTVPMQQGPPPAPAPPVGGQRRKRGKAARPLGSALRFGEAEGEAGATGVDPAPPPLPDESGPGSIQGSPLADDGALAGSDKVAHAHLLPADRRLERPARTVLAMLPATYAFPGFAAGAAVNRSWACGARALVADEDPTPWAQWAEHRWPGIARSFPLGGCSAEAVRQLLQRSVPVSSASTAAERLSQWSFIVDVWRGRRRLWTAVLECSHALPGVLPPDPSAAAATAAEAAPVPADGAPHATWPNLLERLDVVLPGDIRRLAVAGAIAALAEAPPEGGPGGDEAHAARATAVHAASGRLVPLPAALLAGSRRGAQTAAPAAAGGRPALLRAAVGLGARHVLPGPKAMHPAGSLEVHTGLAFAGPGGGWLQGGAAALAAMLEALLVWGDAPA